MESRLSGAFWFILGAICLEIYSVPFGLIKINRVYLLVQVLINLHGYFYVALQLKIQRRRWTDDRAKRVWWVCADDSHFAFLKRICNRIVIYLWRLAQNAKILRRGSCFASRDCATFSILLCKILPRLVCGTPLLPPMFRSSKLEK